jgi:opacity protein-like surface antigen
MSQLCYAQGVLDKLYFKINYPLRTFSHNTGVGYIISPNFEVEFMHSRLKFVHSIYSRNVSTYDVDTSTYSSKTVTYTINTFEENIIDDDQLFGFAFPSTALSRSNCVDNEKTFVTKRDICEYEGDLLDKQLFGFAVPSTSYSRANCADNEKTFVNKSEVCDNWPVSTTSTETVLVKIPSSRQVTNTTIYGMSQSLVLQTFITSVKYNFLGKKEIFIPYVSAGVGVVWGSYKNTRFSSELPGHVFTTRQKTSAFGTELGIGTKIKLFGKQNLDINMKYYDYGRHHFIKRIRGYQFSAGVLLMI